MDSFAMAKAIVIQELVIRTVRARQNLLPVTVYRIC